MNRTSCIPPVSTLLAIAFSATATIAVGQTDNFDDGNDTGWQRLDPTAVLNFFGVPGTYATYTFPATSTGLGYRLATVPPPVGDAGPGRAFGYRSEEYGRLQVGVDVSDWPTGVDEAFGLLIRAGDIGIGSTTGYVMNYNAADGNLQINSITGESPDTIGQTALPLNPADGPFRFVGTASEDLFVVQVFRASDTVNPVGAVIARNADYASGKAGVFVFDRNEPASRYQPTAVTFDNYAATAPAAGSVPFLVTELLPLPGATVLDPLPVFRLAAANFDGTLSGDTGKVFIDGTEVSQVTLTNMVVQQNVTEPFPGVTVEYRPSAVLSNGPHTVEIRFAESNGTAHTNRWNFTMQARALPLALRLPESSAVAGSRGFNVHFVQAAATPMLANSLERAESQLAQNSPIPAVSSTNVVSPVINFSQAASLGASSGTIGDDLPIPGIQEDNTDNFALEATGWVQLPAGVVRLGVQSDDGYSVTSGSVLGSRIAPANESWDVVVPAAGLYPVRLVWWETGGGAHCEFFSEDRTTGVRTLLNGAGGFPVYSAVTAPAARLLASETLAGPFVEAAGVTVDETAGTFSVALSGNTRFFSAEPGITSIRIQGDTVVISYR